LGIAILLSQQLPKGGAVLLEVIECGEMDAMRLFWQGKSYAAHKASC
jgi:hypothetical protein